MDHRLNICVDLGIPKLSWHEAHAIRSGLLAALAPLLLLTSSGRLAGADDRQLERGLQALQSMAGCYLVDYSYVETESLKPGYVRDGRVYDVNRDKSVKEWIYPETLSPRRIRLQRILFATDPAGAVRAGSEIRHQTEDWEYGAPFLYDFVAPLTWHVRDLTSTPQLWTRRVTNLDDGLRYQCAARWTGDTAYPEWTCSNYAPIPGRETRDMRRADYQALDRTTRIIAYGSSWLERQDNVKTIHQRAGASPGQGDGQELVCAVAGCRVRGRPDLRAPAPGVLGPLSGDLGRRADGSDPLHRDGAARTTPSVREDVRGRARLPGPGSRRCGTASSRPGAHPRRHPGIPGALTRRPK